MCLWSGIGSLCGSVYGRVLAHRAAMFMVGYWLTVWRCLRSDIGSPCSGVCGQVLAHHVAVFVVGYWPTV